MYQRFDTETVRKVGVFDRNSCESVWSVSRNENSAFYMHAMQIIEKYQSWERKNLITKTVSEMQKSEYIRTDPQFVSIHQQTIHKISRTASKCQPRPNPSFRYSSSLRLQRRCDPTWRLRRSHWNLSMQYDPNQSRETYLQTSFWDLLWCDFFWGAWR